MSENGSRLLITKYIVPKVKFGLGSLVSTGLDYTMFFGLMWAKLGISIAIIQGIAQATGMASNFIIQRNFIFNKNRGLYTSMALSFGFSLVAIFLSSIAIHWLFKLPFFQQYPILMKVLVTGVFFFFNYYTKQFSFEKKVSL